MRLPVLNRRALVLALSFALVFVLLGMGPRAGAQGQRIPKRWGHINDVANIIDPGTRPRLETILVSLQEKTGIDFVVATVKTPGNEDLYDYSLRVATSWSVGPASRADSVLIVIASESANFLTHVSSSARSKVSDEIISQTGKSLREGINGEGFTSAVAGGIRTFIDLIGAKDNFSFATLDPQGGRAIVASSQVRARSVESPVVQPSENPQPTATPETTPTQQNTPAPMNTPLLVTPPPPETTPTPEAKPSETPATPEPTVLQVATPTPVEPVPPQASPSASIQSVASNSRTSKPLNNKPVTVTSPANPEDEKEEVELTLTLPLQKRIDTLKAFIATHPTSVALPRANELLVVAHALFGEQKLQGGDTAGGLEQFRAAITDAPVDMSDRLFAEVIARIPLNLFFRGQRDAAFDAARQAEGLAKSKAKRLLALAQFYLTIENGDEAGRLAEAATQAEPDSASARQALAAARHIALRLDDAETEYARALALDPKLASARIGLADLKRAAGNFEAALALYREQLQADSKNSPARAGLIVTLFELGKNQEADVELKAAMEDKDQARNLALLTGVAYWFMAHNDLARALDFAQKATALEPRYSWAEIALARASIADKRSLPAERGLRIARQFSHFPTLDYELASTLASMGLYDEAVVELKRSFSIQNGEIETKLAGRTTAHAASFTELLAPERRAAIFQKTPADTDANAAILKGLLAFDAVMNQAPVSEENALAAAQEFIKGNDDMRTFRQIYVADKFLKKGVGLSAVVGLMDQAIAGVEAALSVPTATLAVQPEELGELRNRALARGDIPDVPTAPRAALSGILRGRIEDFAGLALFNLDKPAEAVTRLRRAVTGATEGTPIWRSALWHLGAALDATGKSDQALLYYIKSYVHGPPDPARRSIIETVYKKVNGTLDGLDDKIGAAAATSTPAPSPTPSP